MRYPMDSHRRDTVASLGEHATHEGAHSHGPAVAVRSDERAIYRLQNTRGLPLQPLGDPDAVLRECADDHVLVRRVICAARSATRLANGSNKSSARGRA